LSWFLLVGTANFLLNQKLEFGCEEEEEEEEEQAHLWKYPTPLIIYKIRKVDKAEHVLQHLRTLAISYHFCTGIYKQLLSLHTNMHS